MAVWAIWAEPDTALINAYLEVRGMNMYRERRIHDRGWFVQCNNHHNSLPLLLPLEETRITIFYEYQTGNSIFVVHGNELLKMAGKVTNNIHCMARSTLRLDNEADYILFPYISGLLRNLRLYLITNTNL